MVGTGEEAEACSIVAAASPLVVNLCDDSPILEVMALARGAVAAIGNDTGPMHLAHAVGTPNVAIFGPSDPVRYGPPDNAAVWRRVVRQPVYCSPCNMIRRPPTECARATAPECITGISVEQVLDAVTEALASPTRASGAN